MKYRKDIDGLRSIAVVPVVYYHAGFIGIPGGFMGVDVFFVISGYLITSILVSENERGAFSLLNFYERRARRILPVLFSVVVATVIMGWFTLLPGEFGDLGKSIVSVASFFQIFIFC